MKATVGRRITRSCLVTMPLGLLVCGLVASVAWGDLRVPLNIDGLTVLMLGVAFWLTRTVSIRLPQGDDVCVDQMVGLSGLYLASSASVLLALAAAGVVDAVRAYAHTQHNIAEFRVLDLVRRMGVLALVGGISIKLRTIPTSDGALLALVGLGVLYTVLDVVTLDLWLHAAGRREDSYRVLSLLQPLGPAYGVHVAMAGVAVRLSTGLGAYAFLIAFLFTLILQDGLKQYLRIRRAYAETVQVLAQAAEMGNSDDEGHARRVADLSVTVARGLGMRRSELEHLRYAALLHDIGRIGCTDGMVAADHAKRGAAIAQSIDFLQPAAPIIAGHHSQFAADSTSSTDLAASIVGVCSDFDRARADSSVPTALKEICDSADGLRTLVARELRRVMQRHGVRV